VLSCELGLLKAAAGTDLGADKLICLKRLRAVATADGRYSLRKRKCNSYSNPQTSMAPDAPHRSVMTHHATAASSTYSCQLQMLLHLLLLCHAPPFMLLLLCRELHKCTPVVPPTIPLST
jgi:hypothetical protein